jgi:hypothetical protein
MSPQNRRKRLFITLSTIAACTMAGVPAWSAQKVTYLHVLQAHHMLGPLELFASTGISVIKIKQMDCTLYIDSRVKNPEVLLVCPQKKTYFQCPVSQFEYGLAKTLNTVADLELEPKYWKFYGKKKLFGFEADEYRYRSTVAVYARTEMAYVPERQGETSVKSQVFSLSTPQVTQPFCHLLKRIEHNPVFGGIPLKMETAYAIGRPRNQLDIIKLEVQKLDEFKLPNLQGFKKAKKSSEIFYGQVNVFQFFGK